MFQNVMMMGLTTPLSNRNEITCWENRPFTSVWPGTNQKSCKATKITKTIRKRPKRNRTCFSTEQIRVLEKTFARKRFIDKETRNELSTSLKLTEKTIKIWFQNRRMKVKRDSESSCDSSIESTSSVTSVPILENTQQSSEVVEEKVEFSDHINNYDNYTQFDNYNAESRYQVPYVQYNDFVQLHGASTTALPSTSFCYDTTVYPTQYYPHFYTDNYAQQNNWPSNAEMNYYLENSNV